jgi:protein-tyrosine-phosphatase
MRLRSRILALWKDPVGSNVIAAVIIGVAGYLYVRFAASGSLSNLFAHPLAKIVLPGLVLAVAVLLWHRFRRPYKTLVFVSAGGTCRDPMAKAITTRLLEGVAPKPRIKVRAAGLGPVGSSEASYAARYIIREMYGQDLLKDHRPELLTPDLVKEADLILLMDRSLLLTPGKTLPPTKSFVLKEFFGLKGDVIDPWPDGKDSVTLQRYRLCAEELKNILTAHIDRIVDALKI